MDFGIMFFSSDDGSSSRDKYRLLIDVARYADEQGFCCVWTPERHFHRFGGLFPNPSVTSAALAVVTTKLQIRAGSLISPLHDPIRVAEEWSVVDNLSGGRVAVSFGSGWSMEDFVFFPERYSGRQAIMFEQIQEIKSLWRGEAIKRHNSTGDEIPVTIFPKPIQTDLPIWITSSGNVETFIGAGAIGANVLTHLMAQDIGLLSQKIQRYRESLREHNHEPEKGKVSLMLHTLLGSDTEAVKSKARIPLRNYLKSAISLERKAAASGGVISGGHKIEPHHIPEDVMEDLLDAAFDRYFNGLSLMGDPSRCRSLILALREIGVNEIACLIDFLDDRKAIFEGLEYVNELRASFSPSSSRDAIDQVVNVFLENLDG
jgi:natural product biosynthesis luciferase-like monooxygenase protein